MMQFANDFTYDVDFGYYDDYGFDYRVWAEVGRIHDDYVLVVRFDGNEEVWDSVPVCEVLNMDEAADIFERRHYAAIAEAAQEEIDCIAKEAQAYRDAVDAAWFARF
jgi:hypothetical protein